MLNRQSKEFDIVQTSAFHDKGKNKHKELGQPLGSLVELRPIENKGDDHLPTGFKPLYRARVSHPIKMRASRFVEYRVRESPIEDEH